jgi:amino acid transporter
MASSDVQQREGNLKRDVGLIGLLFASVGSIIGSGWLFGAMTAAQTAGPAALLSWLFGMVMILMIALTFAELGTLFPVSGGPARYPHIAFGSFASYTSGWILWVACATVAPIEVEGALQYATKYAPFTTEHCLSGCSGAEPEIVHTLTTLGYVTAVILMALFVVVNYIGVRWFAKVNNVLVWWKLAIITLVIVAFFVTVFHGSNFSAYGFKPEGWHGVFTAIATSGIVFSYLGFRQGIELAGETKNPRRNVPIAVIGSVVLTIVIYELLQVAFIGAVRPSDLAHSHGWAALSFTNDFGPLAATATILGLGWLAALLYADAVISPADTGLIYTTVTARISYAGARNGNAARGLARTNRQGVPWVSLLLAFVIGLIIFLPFPSWQQLVGFITSATVLSFGSGPLVLAAMRRQLPDQPRPFRLPGGHTLPLLAFFSSNLIIYWSGWTTDWKLFATVLIGFVVLAIFKATGQVTTPMEWKAGATWLVPWLGGLAIISWLGSFGGGRGYITFEIAFPVIAALTLIIYWIAHQVRLSPERVTEHVEESKAEAAVEEQELGTAAV